MAIGIYKTNLWHTHILIFSKRVNVTEELEQHVTTNLWGTSNAVNDPGAELVNTYLNPVGTTVWPHINRQNNKRNFSFPSHHLKDFHECFMWLFNNVDSYAFFIMHNIYAQFKHRSTSDQWLLCTEIWAEAITADGISNWMSVFSTISIWVTSIFWLTPITGNSLFTPKSDENLTARHTHCLKLVDHPAAPSNWLVGSRFFKEELLSL